MSSSRLLEVVDLCSSDDDEGEAAAVPSSEGIESVPSLRGTPIKSEHASVSSASDVKIDNVSFSGNVTHGTPAVALRVNIKNERCHDEAVSSPNGVDEIDMNETQGSLYEGCNHVAHSSKGDAGESMNGYDSDDSSRFSTVSYEHNTKKEETDDENDEHGQFTEECECENKDSDEESRFSHVSNDNEGDESNEVVVKPEPTYAEIQQREAKESRKYGDRVLLARQDRNGMMKLGGGNQDSWLYPGDLEKRMARMNGRFCVAYNTDWNL